jgi:hypothetical protein
MHWGCATAGRHSAVESSTPNDSPRMRKRDSGLPLRGILGRTGELRRGLVMAPRQEHWRSSSDRARLDSAHPHPVPFRSAVRPGGHPVRAVPAYHKAVAPATAKTRTISGTSSRHEPGSLPARWSAERTTGGNRQAASREPQPPTSMSGAERRKSADGAQPERATPDGSTSGHLPGGASRVPLKVAIRILPSAYPALCSGASPGVAHCGTACPEAIRGGTLRGAMGTVAPAGAAV